jgi:hypothetical protein
MWALIAAVRVVSCSEEEKSKMRALISALQMLVIRIEQLVSRRMALSSPASLDEGEAILPKNTLLGKRLSANF